MRILALLQTLSAAAAVTMLAGCSGGLSAALAPKPESPHLLPYTSTRTLPFRDVLYVSDPINSRVDIYPLNADNPAPIGEISSGLETPTGMALDASHDLYVANNTNNVNAGHVKGVPYSVRIYEPGNAISLASYWMDLRHPTDVVVGRDGTVYVASLGDGYVTEYPPGSMTPSQHFSPPSGSAFAVALDAQNNLYVACTNANAVFEFPAGSTQGTNLGLVLSGEPHGMTFDSRGNLLVAVSTAPNSGSVVDVFAPGMTLPSAKISGVFQPFMIDLDRSERHLYVADYGSGNHDGAVFEFAYPSGRLVGKYSQGAASAAYGVAVNPPASF